ncbi:hypothetical protein [Pseudolysinimonas sp.]
MTTTPDYGPSPAQIARMRAKIADGIVVRRKRTRTRRGVLIGTSILTVGALVTGAAILATLPEAHSFSCYPADDLASMPQKVSYPLDLEPTAAVSEQVEWALELCALIRPEFQMPEPADPVVCRLPNLWLGVFPNELGRTQNEVCADLGLLEPEDTVPGFENPSG